MKRWSVKVKRTVEQIVTVAVDALNDIEACEAAVAHCEGTSVDWNGGETSERGPEVLEVDEC